LGRASATTLRTVNFPASMTPSERVDAHGKPQRAALIYGFLMQSLRLFDAKIPAF
jgi:hypothetical protein